MKLLHLSDLHLGKRVNEFSMLEDQDYILREILRIADETRPDAVVIAGDIYDKPVPPAEAVGLFDMFLRELSSRKLRVFIIYGNHDSPERIAFGESLFGQTGVHVSPVYRGKISPIILNDSFGPVNFWLLPYIRPSLVRQSLGTDEPMSYTEACKAAVDSMEINTDERNILVTHQFVTGALRSDSEEISVGGADSVDCDVFGAFDYVALGHLHAAQRAGADNIRYCGAPLKYSLSEMNHKKSATIVELKNKGELNIEQIPLKPLRDMREIRGSYSEITLKSNYDGTPREDYLRIVLTDEEDVPDAVGRLRAIYPNIMRLEYDNKRTRSGSNVTEAGDMSKKTPAELFGELYEKQNGAPMNREQSELVSRLISGIWGDE